MNSFFELKANYSPAGDQPKAIKQLIEGLKRGGKQTLLGVTGSGKTFTIANVLKKINRTALVISHNKTLSAQLFSEFRSFFPNNKVGYFVSYFDYYQPESYIPETDTYIEKDSKANEKIERMRLQATSYLLSEGPSIIVATVSCIYGLGNPTEYKNFSIGLTIGMQIERKELIKKLINMHYQRNEQVLVNGNFFVKGDVFTIFPAYEQNLIRVEIEDNRIVRLEILEPLNFKIIKQISFYRLYPAKHYMFSEKTKEEAIKSIKKELEEWAPTLPPLERHRLEKRTMYDLELIKEIGYCNGIENYSRHFDKRAPGEPPFTLLDFLPQDSIIIIDESHVSIPQLHAMYNGDKTRKKNLVEYGFRLPSAYDNRPLKWEEFEARLKDVIFVSATPGEYERKNSIQIVEQLVRPTGIVDPPIIVQKTENQMQDLLLRIRERVKKSQRILITTLTKRMAEDLTEYLIQNGIKTRYMHSEIDTITRSEIIRELRIGEIDCLVGINLLREGLDIPEVSLLAILDADKQGFLRDTTSLIQTIGRAARNTESEVIMYADTISNSMKEAIEETERRRKIQMEFNKANNIIPQTIIKEIGQRLSSEEWEENIKYKTSTQIKKEIIKLEKEMSLAAEALDFEKAIEIREKIKELNKHLEKKIKIKNKKQI
ncbi:MAG: excinuclease ABC subunit UvrB [Candidatus Anstonellaceae archaeon]